MFIDDAGQLTIRDPKWRRTDGHHPRGDRIDQTTLHGSHVTRGEGQNRNRRMTGGMPRPDCGGRHGTTCRGKKDQRQKNQRHPTRQTGHTLVLELSVFGLHRYSVPIVQASTL